MEFIEYPKIARWSRDVIITEKIDGTNGQIYIRDIMDGQVNDTDELTRVLHADRTYAVYAGSKNRWLKAQKGYDNSGFAQWVTSHSGLLVAALGEGRHCGEWWGAGIQRKYGLKEKRFSLFNVTKHADLPVRSNNEQEHLLYKVPVLYEGPNRPGIIEQTLLILKAEGSSAAPGFMDPEGIVWWHTAANVGFKKTFENDEKGKGQ